MICITYRSTIGTRDIGANFLHCAVEVILPHGIALSRQFWACALKRFCAVRANIAAAVTFAFPGIMNILTTGCPC